MCFYDEVIRRGIKHDHHESDLYVPVTAETTKLINDCNVHAHTFKSELDGKLWYDLPFLYIPFWKKKNVGWVTS